MKNEFLQVGKIVSTHGVRGEIKVLPWADSPEFLLDFDTFYLDHQPMHAESVRVQKTCVLIKFAGINDLDSAMALREKVLFIRKADAKLPEGAVFIQDLLGLPVLCDGRQIGKVTDILSQPGHDVYEVKGEHTYLIPSVPEFILERNVEEGFVRVKLIEGMATDEI